MPDTIHTNRPEFAGEPGYTYVGSMREERPPTAAEVAEGAEFAPEEGWTFESIVKAFPDAFNIDPETAAAIDRGEKTKLEHAEDIATTAGMSLREYLTSDYGIQAAKYGRPPEDWNIPDYSEEGRNRYEQIVFKQIGGNPFKLDPNEEVNKATGYLPTLFDQVFRGQVLYQDRYKMTKKQRDHWESEKNKYRAFVYKNAVAAQKKVAQEYDWMMNKFDRMAKEYNAANDELKKSMNVKVDAFNPETNQQLKGISIDEFNRLKAEDPNWKRGTPISKGAEEKGPSVLDLQRLQKSEEECLSEENLVDGRMAEDCLRTINRMRSAMNLPLLEEIVGEKPAWGPWKKWWETNMPGILGGGEELAPPVTYREESESGEEGGSAVEVPPDGTRGTYLGRKVIVRGGKWVYE